MVVTWGMSTPHTAPPADLSGMHAFLPLLELLPDSEVEAWGRRFDWRVPSLDAYFVKESTAPSARLLGVVGLQSPAEVLVRRGSPRLKALLLRPDLFGPPGIWPHWVASGSLRMDAWEVGFRGAVDMWRGVIGAAWARCDEETLTRIEPWLPEGASRTALQCPSDESPSRHPLWAWAANGDCQDAAVHRRLLERAREWVDWVCGPMARVGHTGRKEVRDKKVWTEWLVALSAVAASEGNVAWLKQTLEVRPDCVRQSQVVAAALGKQNFGIAHWLIEQGVREEAPPKNGQWSSVPWLQNVYTGSHEDYSWECRALSGLKFDPEADRGPDKNRAWNAASAWFIQAAGEPGMPQYLRAAAWTKAFCTTAIAPLWGEEVLEALKEARHVPELKELSVLMRSGTDEAWTARTATWDEVQPAPLSALELSELFFPMGSFRPLWSVDRLLQRAATWMQGRSGEDQNLWMAALGQLANDTNVMQALKSEGGPGFSERAAAAFIAAALPGPESLRPRVRL